MQTAFRSSGTSLLATRLGSGLWSGSSPYRLLAAGALLAAALIPLPVVEHGPILCPFRLLTGIPCPSCGLTRSWVALMHGDLGQSLAFHPLGWLVVILAVPFALGLDRLIPGLDERLGSVRFLGGFAAFWGIVWLVRLTMGWL